METKTTIHTGQILVFNTMDDGIDYRFTARIDGINNKMIDITPLTGSVEDQNSPFIEAVIENETTDAVAFFMDRFLTYRDKIITVEEANNLAKEDLDSYMKALNEGLGE